MTASILLLCALGATATVGEPHPQDAGAPPRQTVLDATGDGHAFLEVIVDRDRYFVHEPIPLRLRAGFDQEFLAERMVELFRRPLDVPAQIQAPWLRELPGTSRLEGSPWASVAAAASARIALNEDSALAVRSLETREDDRRFTVFEVRTSLLPERAGKLLLPEAALRFAYATRFADDFLAGRIAVDRVDALVRSAPLLLRVEEIPDEGRPAGFAGAVGRFALRASTDVAETRLGQSLKLRLTITGEGDLQRFDAPGLSELTGFRVYGVREEEPLPGERVLLYDVEPLESAIRAIPSISFVFFDGTPPAGFRTVHTEPIPLRVHAAADDDPREHALTKPEPGTRATATPLTTYVLGGVAALGVVLVVATLVRRARRRPTPAIRARVREAASKLHADASSTGGDPGTLFAEFLAATLDRPPAAVIGTDLAAQLAEQGIPDDLAARAASLLGELVDARYGGTPPGDAVPRMRELADALQAALH